MKGPLGLALIESRLRGFRPRLRELGDEGGVGSRSGMWGGRLAGCHREGQHGEQTAHTASWPGPSAGSS